MDKIDSADSTAALTYERQKAFDEFAKCFMDHVLDDPTSPTDTLKHAFEKLQLKDAVFTQHDDKLHMHYQSAHEQPRIKLQMKLAQNNTMHLESFLKIQPNGTAAPASSRTTVRAALRTYAEEAAQLAQAYVDAGEPSPVFTKFTRVPRERKNVDLE